MNARGSAADPSRLGRSIIAMVLLAGVVASIPTVLHGQEFEAGERYFNTPDDMIPFKRHEPYVRFFLDSEGTGLEYTGPGRDYPQPEGLESVKIGFLGPLHRVVSYDDGDMMPGQYFEMGQAMLRGAEMAIDEANARGGWRSSLPYELVKRNDPVVQTDFGWLWATFSSSVVELCYDEKVWALFGTIGGENSHILIRIGLKAEVPMMNATDTDPTFPETRIPWIFRVISDDRMQCYALAKYAYEVKGWNRVAAIRYNGRYGRVGIKEFSEASRRLGHPLLIELKFVNGETDFGKRLEAIKSLEPDAVFVWGNAVESARIVAQMRAAGMTLPVIGSDRMLSPEFVEIAGEAAEGVIATSPWDTTQKNPVRDAFIKRFKNRYGVEPETYAAHSFDGMNMLLGAIERAGLNRALIRDALAEGRTRIFSGVTGDIPLNDIYTDAGPISIATHREGRWHYQSEAEAGIDLPRVVKRAD